MKKIVTLVLALLVVMGVMIGCNTQAPNAVTGTPTSAPTLQPVSFPLTITDQLGTKITFEKMPAKIVSLSPTATEIIFALGIGDKMVGKTSYCNFPAEATNVPVIGDMYQPNIENIVASGADFVLATASLEKSIATKIADQKIPVYYLSDDKGIKGAYDSILAIGELFGKKDKALEINASIAVRISDVKTKLASSTITPSTYYVAGYSATGGDFTAGTGTFIDELITAAGGKNIANDTKGWVPYSFEKIVKNNPEIIVAATIDIPGFSKADKYKDLEAVKNGKLFGIDADIINRAGPRLGDAVVALSKLLHPEIWK